MRPVNPEVTFDSECERFRLEDLENVMVDGSIEEEAEEGKRREEHASTSSHFIASWKNCLQFLS